MPAFRNALAAAAFAAAALSPADAAEVPCDRKRVEMDYYRLEASYPKAHLDSIEREYSRECPPGNEALAGCESARFFIAKLRGDLAEKTARWQQAQEAYNTCVANARRAEDGLPPQPPAQQQSQVFAKPEMNGAPVDWCANFAAGCGQEGADQFCRLRGFARASKWDMHYEHKTYVIGWKNFCESVGGHCGALNDVTCVK